MRRLLYSAGFKDVHNKSAFHYATEHKWYMNLCSPNFTEILHVAPELENMSFDRYIEK